MKQEYEEREGVSIDELGITNKEFKQLKEMDMMYGGQTSKEELEEIRRKSELEQMQRIRKRAQVFSCLFLCVLIQ